MLPGRESTWLSAFHLTNLPTSQQGTAPVTSYIRLTCGMLAGAAAHILVLYLWQIALLRPHVVHRAASWLGLYILSSAEPLPALAPQLLHLTALVALFSALGYHAGDDGSTAADDPSTRVRARLSHMMTAPSTAAPPTRGRTQVSLHTMQLAGPKSQSIAAHGIAVVTQLPCRG